MRPCGGSLLAAGLLAGVAGSSVAGSSVAGAARAAPHSTLLIRPAQSIGKIRLAMTDAQLRRVMGRPRVVIRRAAGF